MSCFERCQLRRLLGAGFVGLAVWFCCGPAGSRLEGSDQVDSSLANPLLAADALLAAHKTTAWTNQQQRWLLLEGRVLFDLGAYSFQGDRAVIRIDTEVTSGRLVHHLAIFMSNARPMGGQGIVAAEAPQLLVTVSTTGKVALETNLLDQLEVAPQEPWVFDAVDRIRRYQESLARPTLKVPQKPLIGSQTRQLLEQRRKKMDKQRSHKDPLLQQEALPSARSVPGALEPISKRSLLVDSVLPTKGVVSVGADRIVGRSQDNAILFIGGVRVLYDDQARRQMTLRAERAVIFTDEPVVEVMADRKLAASDIEGVYLEDNVHVSDGEFNLRAPRMYFDLNRNKAVLLEAVLYTFNLKSKLPLYLRAEVLRQTSATSFEADRALLTTSAFAEPHVAIASGRLTVDRTQRDGDQSVDVFTASNNTIQVGSLPIFWWPYLSGKNRHVPLRGIRVSQDSQNGSQIQTSWDLFALAGREAPEGVELLGRWDYLGDHGSAIGIKADYRVPNMYGSFDGYLVPIDDGVDELASSRIIEQDGQIRGLAYWQHRHDLHKQWELSIEAAYISDETFLEEFFQSQVTEAKEYETSVYLKKQDQEWALALLARYDLTDFTPQFATLQAPGYTVNKLPEVGYYRTGTSFWKDRLSWFTENRLSRMQLRFGEDSPSGRGFSPLHAGQLFAMASNESFDDAASQRSIPRSWTFRLDSRHEINAPVKVSVFNLTPYMAGRITAYEDDFQAFSGEDEQIRLWGAVGVRVHSFFSRTYLQALSSLLDLNQLRHVIEPSGQIFISGTTIDSEHLPVYDDEVEAINEGNGVRLGVRNTLQTQRGGPGRWRSVDWVVLDTDVVFRSDDADVDELLPRFFDYRPEYGKGGDHFYSRLLWLVSDTLGVAGDLTYSFEDDRMTQWRIGANLQHTPRLSTFVDYDELDFLSSRLISYGLSYQLTVKYAVRFSQRVDLARNNARAMNLALERRFPGWRLRLTASVDDIEDLDTIGVVLVPDGFKGLRPLAMREY